MRDFYVTLLSNSSLDIYPDNSPANFTNRLPRVLELEPDMEVGLVEVSYVNAFENISSKPKFQVFDFFWTSDKNVWGKLYTFKVEKGYYASSEVLESFLNLTIWKAVPHLNNIKIFKYDSILNWFWFEFTSRSYITVIAHGELLNLLGQQIKKATPYQASIYGKSKDADSYTFEGHKRNFKDHSVFKSQTPSTMYFKFQLQMEQIDSFLIYSDIIEDQMTGNDFTSILRFLVERICSHIMTNCALFEKSMKLLA